MKKSTFLLFLFLLVNQLRAQNTVTPLSDAYMDSLVHASMRTFDIPGIAVGIIKDGKVILAKGYGVRSLKSGKAMDENTLFGIASNSKAFTTTALGILIDEGKLKWDDKVREYIPEFKLYSPFVTEEFTIKDLITHRSGLGLGAGDLMFWPDSNNFQLKEIIYNLRYLKPVSSFRTQYDYDNLLYMVAGEIVHRVSGMEWEEFIQKRILNPLGMNKTAPYYALLSDKSDVIDGHAKFDGKVQVIPRNFGTNMKAAGGIYSNITDLSKWVLMHLNEGVYGADHKILISKRNHDEIWSPQTIIPVHNPGPYHTHFASYGLGFFISDVNGYKELTHTGGLEGMVTEITMIPELKLGIIVLTNQEVGLAFRSITNQIKDHYLGIAGTHRVEDYGKIYNGRKDNFEKEVKKVWAKSDSVASLKGDPLKKYLGIYSDPWMGDLSIHLENGQYRVDFKRSLKLSGSLFPYTGNAALVKWDRHNLDADAYMIFNLDENGKAVSISMRPISEETDFSYDFQDLNFKSSLKN